MRLSDERLVLKVANSRMTNLQVPAAKAERLCSALRRASLMASNDGGIGPREGHHEKSKDTAKHNKAEKKHNKDERGSNDS